MESKYMTFYSKDNDERLQLKIHSAACTITEERVSIFFNQKKGTFDLYQMIIEGQSCIHERRVPVSLADDFGPNFYKLDATRGTFVEIVLLSNINIRNEIPLLFVNDDDCNLEDMTHTPLHDEDMDCSNFFKEQIQENSLRNKILCYATKSIIGRQISETQEHQVLTQLPNYYNGNIVFELPPVDANGSGMDGMQQLYDPHIWTRPNSTSIVALKRIAKVRLSHCGGSFQCANPLCSFLLIHDRVNDRHWKGRLMSSVDIGEVKPEHGSLECLHCGEQPFCTSRCSAKIYYCEPEDVGLTRLAIHVGYHDHPIGQVEDRDELAKARQLVQDKVNEMPYAGARKVEKELAREIISQNLLSTIKIQDLSDSMSDTTWENILLQLQASTNQRRFRRWIHDALKSLHPKRDSLDSIVYLREHLRYDFLQSFMFPGQSIDDSQPCYVMKMSTRGRGSGLDIVNSMRPGGHLGKSWVHFDHVRRVRGWTTMAAHVYDPSVRELLTIASCEFKKEDTDAQILFWSMLNGVIEKCGFDKPHFHGFMADEAQANWRAVRTVYNGGPENVMIGRERSCIFHWEQGLQRVTKKYIYHRFQDVHLEICRAWRDAKTKDAAHEQSRIVRAWWRNDHADANDIPFLDQWMSWWEDRIPHWGAMMVQVMDSETSANTPRTNLSESKHGSWLASEGFVRQISLYDACIGDLSSALLQIARCEQHHKGLHIGSGPSLQNLLHRIGQSRSSNISPQQAVKVVNSTIHNTSVESIHTHLPGNVESVRQKKTVGEGSKINDSHRHDYKHVVCPRTGVHKPASRVLLFDEMNEGQPSSSQPQIQNQRYEADPTIHEEDVHDVFWAIRRCKRGSKVRCQAWLSSKGSKCGKLISENSFDETVAPCFKGRINHSQGQRVQFFWFCGDDVSHAWTPSNKILDVPNIPSTWPIQRGVQLATVEVSKLQRSGFQITTSSPFGLHQQSGVVGTPSPTIPIETPSNSSRRKMKRRSIISKACSDRIDRCLRMKAIVNTGLVRCIDEDEDFNVISFDSDTAGKEYTVRICSEPSCTCKDFANHLSQGAFAPCKHMYFIYIRVLGQNMDYMSIHQPRLTTLEVFQLLTSPRVYVNHGIE